MKASDSVALVARWTEARLTENVGWLLCGLLALAYVAYFTQLTALPFQDLPNHLARAVVLADLIFHDGAQFGQVFDFQAIPVAYVLGDMLFVGLVEVLGPTAAAAVWTAFVLLSLPAAVLVYLRVNGASWKARQVAFVLCLYLATDWFFLLGFMQFRLGIAVLILALACVDQLRRHWSRERYLGYCALLLVAYGVHLTAVVFMGPAVVMTALVRLWFRRTTLAREAWLVAPVLAVLAWQFGVVQQVYSTGDETDWPLDWGTLEKKHWGLTLGLLRVRTPLSKLLILMFGASIVWGTWRYLNRRALQNEAFVEMLALAAAFLGLFVVLPAQYSATYVDVRALPFAALFLMLAFIRLRETAPLGGVAGHVFVWSLAALLAVFNLASVARYIGADNRWGKNYREIVALVPRGAHVLPIYTNGLVHDVFPRLHIGSFVVVDRGGVTPGLFSGKSGSHMQYFRYRSPLYQPPEYWYDEGQPVAWGEIACSYQYLLVGKPYDGGRIGVPTATLAENQSAALLAIDRQGQTCGS